MASDTADGSTTVKISNQEVMLKNKSNFSKSSGDEAGSAPKKGVVTSNNMGKVYFNAWSMDVKFEGENVPRNLDITTNNHMSKMPGNTPPMPHVSSMAMGMGAPKCEACAAAARAGNPVNPLRGNKLLDGPDDIDFVLEGPLDLVWQRVYMSNLALVGFFGQGWITPVEMHLVVDRWRVIFVDREGRSIPFPAMEVGDTYFHRQDMCMLARVTSDTFRLEQSDGLVLTFSVQPEVDHAPQLARLARMSDPNENTVALTWDAQGLLQRIDGSGEHALSFEWRSGRLQQVTRFRKHNDAAGAASQDSRCVVAKYSYSNGDLVGVTIRGGRRSREFEWKNHIMVWHAQPGGLECFYEWTSHEPDGKVLRSWTNTGSELRFNYGEHGTAVVDQDGATETFIADGDGHWVAHVDKAGGQHRRVLDPDGHLIGTVAPSGSAIKSELDERGLPVRIWDAAGQVSETSWHPILALPLTETDPLGRTERYAYDERGNLLSHTLADGSQTLYEYEERGLPIAMIDALGKRQSFEYDRAGRMTQMIDCTDSRERYEYDEHGQLIAVIDALGHETRCVYSPAGDPIAVTDSDGTTTTLEYDALGRLTGETEPAGGRSTVRLRADGLAIAKVDANGRTTRYTRDSSGRLLQIENPNGATYTLEYNRLGSVTRMKTFEGIDHLFGYSEDGALAWSEERGGRNGEIIKFTYSHDPNGRPTRTVASDGEWKEYEYDAAGQLVAGRNRHAVVSLKYDAAGRCVGEAVCRAAPPASAQRAVRALNCEYDGNGNVVRTSIPGVTELAFLHYGSGHLHQILAGGKPYCDIERDAAHLPRSLTHQALVSRLAYDDASQLTGINTGPDPSVTPVDATRPLITARFAYDPDGDLIAVERSAPWGRERQQFRYDASRRVVAESGTHTQGRSIHWDGAFNPVDTPGERVRDNMVRTLGSLSAEYDGFGRLRDRSSQDGRVRLEWNAFHQLVGARADRNGASYLEQYSYDAFGRRIAKITNGSETAYLWDGERLLMEEDEGHCRVFVYHEDGQEPIGFVLAPAQIADTTDPLDDQRFFYLHDDPSGAPFALTDEAGIVLWHASYDAFGAAIDSDHLQQADRLNVQPLRLQGQYFDAATGLYYNRYRYFDPESGRFISPDPIWLFGGENFYEYAPNPFSWIDPLGLKLKNKIAGEKRQKAAVKKIESTLPAGAKIQEECSLRSCKTGKVMKDPKKTGPGEKKYRTRRLDVVVIHNGAVLKAIEVTSMTASKDDQLAKERRIRARGGTCIKDRATGDLIPVPSISKIMRLP
jgi:RHS repeat-associated protein